MKTKYVEGYIHKEITQMCKNHAVPEDKFWEEFGINTVMTRNGETVYFANDVERAINRLKTGEKQHWTSWD